MARRLDRRQLQIIAGRAVQLYVEVALGRRPPRTLDRFSSPDARVALREQFGSERRSVLKLERITIHPPVDRRVDITALVRDDDEAVSVVALELQARGDRWVISDARHLRRGRHYTSPAPMDQSTSPETTSPTVDLAILRGAAAQAALAAADAAHPSEVERLTSLAALFRHRAEDLASSTLAESASDELPAYGVESYATALLGPLPRSTAAQERWSEGVRIIDNYRNKWNVADGRRALGGPPSTAPQRDSRNDAFRRLAEIVSKITGLESCHRLDVGGPVLEMD